jgi:hypothetical protein
MVVDFAPNVTWFKSKRSYSSDYFAAKPDKAVLKAVLWKYILLYLIYFMVI